MSAVAEIFKAIANRPPILWGFIGALIATFGGSIEPLEPYKDMFMLVLPPIFGYIASRFTVGPATGKALAEAVEAVQTQILKNPDASVESAAPPLKAVRAAKRVLK